MKYLIVTLSIMLTACASSVPVVTKWPDPPSNIALERCPNLQKISDDPKLSDVAKTITVNYGTYYECAVKADAWQEWYQIQKKIHEDLKK
jgi:hypothetical protein